MFILQVIPPPPPGPPGGWPGPSPFEEPCVACVPLDEGAIVLIIIGLLIGLHYTIKERNKNRKQW